MIPISSRENPVFKSFCKCGQKKYRRAMGCYLCEGAKMAAEALDFGLSVRAAFVREGEEERFGPLIGRLEGRCPVYRLTAPLFQTLCDAVTPQGVCLALEIPKHMPEPARGNCLILDGVSDPGNLGGILRTANACGYRQIYLVGCTDPYAPKAVRASMSGVFFPALYEVSAEEAVSLTAAVGRLAADMGGENVFEAEIPSPHCLVIGSESHGVSDLLRAACGRTVSLPMQKTCESLNAAVAASVLMYRLTWGSR